MIPKHFCYTTTPILPLQALSIHHTQPLVTQISKWYCDFLTDMNKNTNSVQTPGYFAVCLGR